MTKRTTRMPLAGRCRRWSTALMVAVLAGGDAGALAQSELRFVDSQSGVANSASAPTTDGSQSCSQLSEFKLLDLSEAKTAPLPQFSLTRPRETAPQPNATESTSLKFATAPQENAATAPTSVEMRFVAKPESKVPQRVVVRPVGRPLEVAVAPPAAISPQPEISTVPPKASPTAIELFAKLPPTQPTEFKPRIVSSLEHVPAPVPQHVTAQPVRAAREAVPTITPPGSELFTANAPKKWDLPALDYGAALKRFEPPTAVEVAPRSIEPTQIVARELPSTATEMFTLAPSEPIVSPARVAVAPQMEPVAEAAPPIASTNAARKAAVVQVPAPAQVVTTPPVAEPAQVAKPLFVSTPPKLPEATELEMSRVAVVDPPTKVAVAPPMAAPVEPVRVASRELPSAATGMFTLGAPEQLRVPAQQPEHVFIVPEPTAVPVQVAATRPQFVSAPPATPQIARAQPIVPPSSPQRLVPAAVVETPVAQKPFAYEAGKLANEPVAAEPKPAVSAPAMAKPDRNQVSVTQETGDPNVYKFHFANSTGATPTQLVHSMQPTPVETAPVEVGPEAVPAPYEGGGNYGQMGCPYLPGQSGTRALCGVDCGRCGAACNSTWSDAQCIPWALFGPGEYVGPARPAHVETYFLRVNDNITLTFIQSRKKTAEHYRIGVGDELQIEWLQGAANTEVPLDRKLLVQPDGTVTLPLIGDVVASGKTIHDFRDEVVKLYSKYQRDPQITVTPLTVNVAVQDVLKAVTAKNQSSGQTQDVKVTPEGTIQAAGIGSVFVQGLTLDELRSELEARYSQAYGPGLNVSPQLTERATSYVFMGGEVKAPGRYTLEGPTTVMQAVALAGGWNNGGNLRQVVIFRRDENWCLKATKIDIRAPYYGKDPCPMNDIWLRDNDLVIVPKSCILCATDLIELYFTRGVYAVFPINYVYDFSSNSGIVPVGP